MSELLCRCNTAAMRQACSWGAQGKLRVHGGMVELNHGECSVQSKPLNPSCWVYRQIDVRNKKGQKRRQKQLEGAIDCHQQQVLGAGCLK